VCRVEKLKYRKLLSGILQYMLNVKIISRMCRIGI